MRYIDRLLAESCRIARVDPPNNEQQACSKQVEAYYGNKLRENIAPCWFILYAISNICDLHLV
jgi:hypothetical protein